MAVEAIELIPERVATTESVEKVRKTEIVVDKGSNELIQNKNCDAAANLEDTLERKEKEVVVEKAVDVSDVSGKVAEPEPVRPSIENVYVTAIIENSNASKVTEVEINTLHTIIRSKEHEISFLGQSNRMDYMTASLII